MVIGGLAIDFGAAVRKLNGQGAVLNFFKQLQNSANRHWGRLNFGGWPARGASVHDQLVLEMTVEEACARETPCCGGSGLVKKGTRLSHRSKACQ